MMLIGELAKAAGVGKDTVRHYDELNLLIAGDRVAGSRTYREYAEENITRIKMIRGAKNMGFSLADVRKITQQYDDGEIPDSEIITLLREKLILIQEKIISLKETEQVLVDKLKGYE